MTKYSPLQHANEKSGVENYYCATGVNILSRDPLGPSFQQKKIELKSVHKQKS